MGIHHTLPIPMDADNLWQFFPAHYGKAFVNSETGGSSKELAKAPGWILQLDGEKHCVTCYHTEI